MLILIGGEKGGTGKTTTSVNLVTMRAINGADVFLYDIDPQLTSTLWASARDQNGLSPRIPSSQKVLGKEILNPGLVIRNELKALLPKYQDIIVDAGGADNEVLRAAMTLADIIIFPLKSSDFDMWTFEKINSLVANAQNHEKEKVGYILLNEVSTNPGEAKQDILDFDDLLTDFEHLHRLKSIIYKRKPIRKATGKGMAVIEYKPVDEKAVSEYQALYQEVFNEL